jgi:hypothetical protein
MGSGKKVSIALPVLLQLNVEDCGTVHATESAVDTRAKK